MSSVNYAAGAVMLHTNKQEKTEVTDVRAARQRRIDALKSVAGMWADRKDIPADGLEYQRELRAEWR